MNLDCALSCRSWIDTLVALNLLSQSFLVDPIARDRSIEWLGVNVGYGRWLSGRNTTWQP
jgi:hypothetical protein